MKHVFIVNPSAGKGKGEKIYLPKMQMAALENRLDFFVHITKPGNDTKEFVMEFCNNEGLKEKSKIGEADFASPSHRFYVLGGDGTLNEVINGMAMFSGVEVAHVPTGSGNDFVRNFVSKEDFLCLERQIKGASVDVDLIGFELIEGYKGLCVNMINLGMDSEAVYRMSEFKRLPFVSGSTAYVAGLSRAFFGKLGYKMKVKIHGDLTGFGLDDENGDVGAKKFGMEKSHLEGFEWEEFEGEFLLSTIGNGKCYGGGFCAAPNAKLNDGKLEVCFIKTVGRGTILGLVSSYKKGNHLQDKKFEKYITYRQAKSVEITSDEEIKLSIDGEIILTKGLKAKIIEKGIKFVLPY